MNEHLATFVQHMDEVVNAKDDPRVIADETERHLSELLRHPEFLDAAYREPNPDRYRQHIVFVQPEGKYSLVSLVWRPGQATPVHDHRCWCVVGVLQGHERETRYHLYGGDEQESVLVLTGDTLYGPGEVCSLVPPDEDIHKVANAGDDGLTISLHTYGANIEATGTSINHVFNLPVVTAAPAGTKPISWRDANAR